MQNKAGKGHMRELSASQYKRHINVKVIRVHEV